MTAKLIGCLTLLTLYLFGGFCFAYPAKQNHLLRQQFLRSESEIKKGNFKFFLQHRRELEKYPLYPYLHHQYLQRQISKVSLSELQNFEYHYPDFPLMGSLKKSWLLQRAASKDWKTFMKVYQQIDPSVELQCHYINAHLQTHGDRSILNQVKKIWLYAHSRPQACNSVFETWEKAGYMTRTLIWKRIKLAIEDNNPSLAEFLSKKLNRTEQAMVELWIKTYQNPYRIKNLAAYHGTHPAIAEMLAQAIMQIAKKNPEHAIRFWKKISLRYKFGERHWGDIVRSISLSLAYRRHPDAEQWLRKIPKHHMTAHTYLASLRTALLHDHWTWVLELASSLPENLKKEESWRYWYARALEKQGQRQISQEHMVQLSKNRSYYGLLAGLRVLRPYVIHNETRHIGFDEISAISYKPGILRARELQSMGRQGMADAEWRYSIQLMSDNERMAAAKLASHWKSPNWSITALAGAQNKNDLSLRFPKTYSEHIIQEARRNHLDPAWIFAIIRQESAFISTARSSAGALGLMQLIPSTAKMVARLSRTPYRHHHELLQADKNIRLGSKYLRMMLDKNQNNPVLATAAYNAGPGRIHQWLPSYDMPADCWIDTIPFGETRNYVQNVLTYTGIYKQLLGQKVELRAQMPMINRHPSKQKSELSKG